MVESGVIVVNKPKGYTSRDIVNIISKKLGTKKVGHTGTLDPLAEGVLIVCFGNATKIVELLTAHDKEYISGARLGIETNTYDIEGTIIAEKDVAKNIELENVLKQFKKTYLQEVPIYSAIKVNGKKLYEYARKNESIELPKKEVTIKNIELLEYDGLKDFQFKVNVTKGCYIRSLIHDIGAYLNTGATMTSLVRTKQGIITLDMANSLEDIEAGNIKILSIEEVLEYPSIEIDEDLYKKIKNGMKIENYWDINDKVLFKYNNKIIGIYIKDGKYLKTWKNFNII